MKMAFMLLCSLIALTLSANAGNEEYSYGIGLTAGYDQLINPFYLPACLNDDPLQPTILGGTANTGTFGLSYEMPVFNNSWSYSFIGKLTYEKISSHTKADWRLNRISMPYKPDNGDTVLNKTVDQENRYLLDFSENLLSAELLFMIKPFDAGLGLVAGPTFSYSLSNSYSLRLTSTEPEDYKYPIDRWDTCGCGRKPLRYEDNGRTIVYEDGASLPGLGRLRVGLTLGVQYEISFYGFMLVPYVSLNYGLTERLKDWNLNIYKAGLDARILF